MGSAVGSEVDLWMMLQRVSHVVDVKATILKKKMKIKYTSNFMEMITKKSNP